MEKRSGAGSPATPASMRGAEAPGIPPSPPPALVQAVERARQNRRRVQPVTAGGQNFWVKFARGKSWAVQISKGDPRRALAREIALMRALGGGGAPVAELVLHGKDYYVVRDAGTPLSTVFRDSPDDPELPAAFAAAGRALAEMHRQGATHGRPYLRDICWLEAERRITFIDFERGARLRAGPARKARDVALLLLSVYAIRPDARGTALADACLAAYFAHAPAAMRTACARFARRWAWLPVLTAPMHWHEKHYRQDRRWKEYTAVPLALAHLRER